MTPLEIMFLLGSVSSFLGGFVGVILALYLDRKRAKQIEKLKKSIQHQVRKLKDEWNVLKKTVLNDIVLVKTLRRITQCLRVGEGRLKMTRNRCPECGGRFKPEKLDGFSQQDRNRLNQQPVQICKKCGGKFIKVRRSWQLIGRVPVEDKKEAKWQW